MQSSPAIEDKSQKEAGPSSPGARLPSLYGAPRGQFRELDLAFRIQAVAEHAIIKCCRVESPSGGGSLIHLT